MKQLFRQLARVLGGIESGDVDIEDVEVAANRSQGDESIDADVRATIPIVDRFETPPGSEVHLDDVAVGDDGTIRADLAVTLSADAVADGEVDLDTRGGGATGESESDAESASTPTSKRGNPDGGDGATSKGDNGDAETDGRGPATGGTDEPTTDGVPPHHDPERLRAVYDPEKTFKEMTEELGVDVTPQTVRWQMIERGIHEPGSDADGATGSEDATEPENANGPETDAARETNGTSAANGPEGRDDAGETATDGGEFEAIDVSLPEGVTILDLRDAVANARTVYEVQRSLGLEREETRTLLERFDLLSVVSGRLAAAEEAPSVEEIHERIRSATAN